MMTERSERQMEGNNNNNKGTKIFQRDILLLFATFSNFSRIFYGSIVNTELIKWLNGNYENLW